VVALHDFLAGTEQQESPSSVRALRLTLAQALVANQSALLITYETTDGDADQGTIGHIAVDFGSRDKLGQD